MSVPSADDIFASSVGDSGDVTVEMMDYQFINKSNNIKELEKILRALRSGKHGYYPHLIQHCEDKISKLNPKSKLLRKEKPVLRTRDLSEGDREDLTNGLESWRSRMKESEELVKSDDVKEDGLPPVRSSQGLKGKGKKLLNGDTKKNKDERIKSWDFKNWDKYDADQECEKIDQAPDVAVPMKRKATLPHTVDASDMSDNEKVERAGKEKDKGNEAFKAGDYDEALAYYSRSISLIPSAASINNRALVHLRLSKWEEAVADCNQVLLMEDNLKARLRRATALKELGRSPEARTDLEFVLSKEPNNARAQKLLSDVEGNFNKKKKGRKMEIAEVQSDEEEVTKEKQTLNGHETSSDNHHGRVHEVDAVNREDTAQQQSAARSNANNGLASQRHDSEKHKTSPAEGRLPATDGAASIDASSRCGEKPVIVQKPLPGAVEKIKQVANDLFRAGQYGSAAEKYTRAISRMNQADEYAHALALLHNNRAACRLKIGEDNGCIDDCSRVLELKPFDVKALVRRASAYEHKEKYEKAYVDFKTAQMRDLSAFQAQDGSNRVAKHLRDVYGPKWKDKLPEMPDVKMAPRPVGSFQGQTPSNATASEEHQKTDTPNTEDKVSVDQTPGRKDHSDERRTLDQGSSSKSNVSASGKPLHVRQEAAKSTPKNGGKEKPNKASAVVTSEEEKMKEKKDKIRQEVFEKVKNEGNDLVRAGNYAEGVERYSKCIQIDPSQVAGYTNRALCFLKLGKNVSAELDCIEALKRDPSNVKAYFRRAQARKNNKMFKQAEMDLRKVIQLDPTNKRAQSELADVERSVRDFDRLDEVMKRNEKEPSEGKGHGETKTSLEPSPRVPANQAQRSNKDESHKKKRKMLIEEVSEDEEDAGAVPENQPRAPQDSGPAMARVGPAVATNEPSGPLQPVVTPYEFGHLWDTVSPKDNLPAYKRVMDQVPLDLLPSLVSNKTTDHMILIVARISRIHAEADDVERAYQMMSQLTKAQRFNMAAMFLSTKDKQEVGGVIAKLEACASSGKTSFNAKDLNELKKLYML